MPTSKYASTKFVLAMAGLLVGSVLVWLDKISGTEFVSLNSILGGGYMLTNAYITGKSGGNANGQ